MGRVHRYRVRVGTILQYTENIEPKMRIITEHNLVRGVAVHLLGFHVAVEQLDVSTAAVDVLFVFDGVLDHKVSALVAERGKLPGQRVEPGVVHRLYALVNFVVVVEIARAAHELAELCTGVSRVRPSVLPRFCTEKRQGHYTCI